MLKNIRKGPCSHDPINEYYAFHIWLYPENKERENQLAEYEVDSISLATELTMKKKHTNMTTNKLKQFYCT